MARNFLDEEPRQHHKLGYMDGFRFGFGQFIAWLLGVVIAGGLIAAVLVLLRLR